jgi:hypothetical protein
MKPINHKNFILALVSLLILIIIFSCKEENKSSELIDIPVHQSDFDSFPVIQNPNIDITKNEPRIKLIEKRTVRDEPSTFLYEVDGKLFFVVGYGGVSKL